MKDLNDILNNEKTELSRLKKLRERKKREERAALKEGDGDDAESMGSSNIVSEKSGSKKSRLNVQDQRSA